MTEIRQADEAPARRSWLRPALVAGAVAAVSAVTLTIAVPSDEQRPAPAASQNATGRAGEATAPTIRDDQFVYIRSKVSWTGYDMGKKTATIEPLREREVWLSVDGSKKGEANDPYRGLEHQLLEADAESLTAYRNLQKLPTDPDKMYDWLNRESQGGSSKEAASFALVGDLVHESLIPPAQAAALYRAAARIPGVFVIDDAVDAAGRHGVAVARIDEGQRQELIFDKETKEFLGERQVAVEDGSMGIKKGDVTSRTAVLERTVVDKRGERS